MYATIGFPHAYSAFLVYILPTAGMILDENRLRVVEQMVIITNIDFDGTNLLQWFGPLTPLYDVWKDHVSEAVLCRFFEMSVEDYRKEVSTGYFWATMGNTKPSNCVYFWANFFDRAVPMIPMIVDHYGFTIPKLHTQAAEMYVEAKKKLDDTRREVHEKNERIANLGPEGRANLDKFNEQMARSNPDRHLHDYKMDQYYQKDMNEKFAYGSFIDTHFRQEVQLFTQVCSLTNAILVITTNAINASLPPPTPPALNDGTRQYVLGMFWQNVHPLFGRLETVALSEETARLVQTSFTLNDLVNNVCTIANLNEGILLFQNKIAEQGMQILVNLAQQIEIIKRSGRLSNLSYMPGEAAAAVPPPQSSAAGSPVAGSAPVQLPPQAAVQSPQSSGQGSPVSVQSQPSTPASVQSQSQPSTPVSTAHMVQQPDADQPGTPRNGYNGSFGAQPQYQPHQGNPFSFGAQPGYQPQAGYQQSFEQVNMMDAGSKKTRTKRSVHKHKRSVHKHKRSAHKHKRSVHKHKRISRKHK